MLKKIIAKKRPGNPKSWNSFPNSIFKDVVNGCADTVYDQVCVALKHGCDKIDETAFIGKCDLRQIRSFSQQNIPWQRSMEGSC